MILNWGMQQSSPPTLASYRAEMSKFTIVYTLRILVYILVNLLLYEYIYIYIHVYIIYSYMYNILVIGYLLEQTITWLCTLVQYNK